MTLPVVALGLFLLGQVGRFSFNQQEVNVYLYEIPYFLWIVFLFFKQRDKHKLPKAVIIFLGVLVATFLFGIFKVTAYQNIVSFMYLVRLALYLVGFNLTIEFFAKKPIHSIYLKVFLTLTGTVGIIQYFFYSNLRNLQYLGWDPHQSRVFGLFLDTSVAGAVYGLILIFVLLNQKLFSNGIRILFAITYALIGLFTYSRGFLASILASVIGYSLVVKKNWLLLILVAEIVIMFVAVAPTPFGEGVNLLRTSTIESRVADYNQGFELWKKNPVIGVGYNRIRYFKPAIGKELRGASHAGASFHSSYLVILVTAGVVGLGAFAYWLWTVAKISNFAMLSAIFLGAYSFFDNILLHPFILFLWPVLIGFTSRKKQ